MKKYSTIFFSLTHLILKMTEPEKKELLRQAQQILDKRKKDRIHCLIPARYLIKQDLYRSYILDINHSGAFIETDKHFAPGLDIFLEYFDPFSRTSSEYKGEVVWSSNDGIGVKFDYPFYSGQ